MLTVQPAVTSVHIVQQAIQICKVMCSGAAQQLQSLATLIAAVAKPLTTLLAKPGHLMSCAVQSVGCEHLNLGSSCGTQQCRCTAIPFS